MERVKLVMVFLHVLSTQNLLVFVSVVGNTTGMKMCPITVCLTREVNEH
jgi:hypothetical protein